MNGRVAQQLVPVDRSSPSGKVFRRFFLFVSHARPPLTGHPFLAHFFVTREQQVIEPHLFHFKLMPVNSGRIVTTQFKRLAEEQMTVGTASPRVTR